MSQCARAEEIDQEPAITPSIAVSVCFLQLAERRSPTVHQMVRFYCRGLDCDRCHTAAALSVCRFSSTRKTKCFNLLNWHLAWARPDIDGRTMRTEVDAPHWRRAFTQLSTATEVPFPYACALRRLFDKTKQHTPVHYNAIQCNTIQCNALQCNTI